MQTDLLAENIRKRFDHTQAKIVLQEKYASKMLFTHNQGMWRAGPDLITQCNLCIVNSHPDPVLKDIYSNPVRVNAEELKNLALERWQEQMNGWLTEFEEIATKR
jgi:hypothetical protein